VKYKTVFLLSFILVIVSAAGCLNDPHEKHFDFSSLNPLNKDIEPYQFHPENIPSGEDVVVYRPSFNFSLPAYQYESLVPESDMAFYGTVQTINTSEWLVIDEKFNFIITPVIFEIDDLIKGENTETVVVTIWGGQIDDYIMTDYSYPLIWDLREGQQYLVYLKKDGNTGNYYIMAPTGLFVVLN